MSKYYHWAPQPIGLLKEWPYKPMDIGYKPNGLWFDVDEDWKRWCEAEHFTVERLRFRHEVRIESERVLQLATMEEIDRFTDEYFAWPSFYTSEMRRGRENAWIDWRRVGERHSGIVIAPYCWERRMSLMWYYGWDCASGCVWDIQAIGLGPAEEPSMEPSRQNSTDD